MAAAAAVAAAVAELQAAAAAKPAAFAATAAAPAVLVRGVPAHRMDLDEYVLYSVRNGMTATAAAAAEEE